MRKFVAGCLVAAAALAMACTGESAPEPAATPAPDSEDALAASLVLTAADFPRSWIHQPSPPDDTAEPNPFAGCFPEVYAGETGRAEGGEFSDSNTTQLSINPAVYTFASAKDAETAIDSLPNQLECMSRIIRSGEARGEDSAIRNINLSSPPIKQLGDQTQRTVVVYEVEYSATDTDALVFDIVHVRRGRFVAEVTGFQREFRIDEELLLAHVDRAFDKIEAVAAAEDGETVSAQPTETPTPAVRPNEPARLSNLDLESMVLPFDAYGPQYAHLVIGPDSGRIDNSRAATSSLQHDDSGEDMAARGRIEGYALWFQRVDSYGGGGPNDGLYAVGSGIEMLEDAGAATQFMRDDLDFAAGAIGTEVYPHTKLGAATSFSTPRIGDETFGVVIRLDPIGNDPTWFTTIIFRRDNLVSSVNVSRTDENDAKEEARRLALLLDARITAASLTTGATPTPRVVDGETPPRPPGLALGNSLGMRCTYPSRFIRERYGLPPGPGCVIIRLTVGGAAERAGILIGDRLVRVDDTPVTSGRQFVAEVLTHGRGPYQRWTVQRGAQEVVLDFWIGPSGAPPLEDQYADYLAGRDNVDLRIDIAHFDAAIAKDPAFDLAYLYRGQKLYDVSVETRGDTALARADIDEALRLDPDLSEAREMLAHMLSYSGSARLGDALIEINAALRGSSCNAPPEYWDYDCGALLLERARIRLMAGDDINAEGDLIAASGVRALQPEREELANQVLQARKARETR